MMLKKLRVLVTEIRRLKRKASEQPPRSYLWGGCGGRSYLSLETD